MTGSEGLTGTWILHSLYGESAEGEIWQICGESPRGMLVYTAEGTTSVVLMQRGRPKFAAGLDAPTVEELRAAFFGFDAYCGTYTVDAAQKQVTHHILGSRMPDWEGSAQVRYFELEGDSLRIRSAPIPARGTEWTVYVVWSRYKAA